MTLSEPPSASATELTTKSLPRRKVLLIAYGHPDNVFSLARRLGTACDLTVMYVAYGERFTRGLLDLDLKRLPIGVTTDSATVAALVGPELWGYVHGRCQLYLCRVASPKVWGGQGFRNLGTLRALAKWVREQRPAFEVIHYNGFSAFQIPLHYMLSGYPRVITIHDFINHSGEKKAFAEWLNKRIAGSQQYQIIQHYESLRQQVITESSVKPRKVHTVILGPFDLIKEYQKDSQPTDTESESMKGEETPFSALFFGRISPYKGVDTLLEAAELLAVTHPQIQITIAGSGPLPQGAESLIERLGNVKLIHRYIENDELCGLLRRHAIVVLPYTDATHSAVLTTAYAFGKPIIATNVGGLGEVVKEAVSGFLVPPKDPKQLAEAIAKALEPATLAQLKQGVHALTHGGEVSWERAIASTIAVYEAAIAHN